MKYWCSQEKKKFDYLPMEQLDTKICPNCHKPVCDWGPVVEPDDKQKEQLHAIFDAKIPGVTLGVPAEKEDMMSC